MTNSLPSIDLKIVEKLKNRGYRQDFFLAESSAMIASQLIALRNRRDLNQTEVAELIDTQQPAISRVERADYRNWSFNTLRRLADAMDARLRVTIQPVEDILHEYSEANTEFAALKKILQFRSSSVDVTAETDKTSESILTQSVADKNPSSMIQRAATGHLLSALRKSPIEESADSVMSARSSSMIAERV